MVLTRHIQYVFKFTLTIALSLSSPFILSIFYMTVLQHLLSPLSSNSSFLIFSHLYVPTPPSSSSLSAYGSVSYLIAHSGALRGNFHTLPVIYLPSRLCICILYFLTSYTEELHTSHSNVNPSPWALDFIPLAHSRALPLRLLPVSPTLLILFSFMQTCFSPHLKKREGEKEIFALETSLVVQWLRLCAPNAGGPVLIPGWGTRSCMPQLRDSVLQLKEPACRS